MKHFSIILLTALTIITISSCEKYSTAEWIENAVTDYDGNTYNAVKIGQQIWMTENLRTEHFADGREIPYTNEIQSYTSPYRYSEDDFHLPEYQYLLNLNYGYYYNGAAVMDTQNVENVDAQIQGICPDGWHVPALNEWQTLFSYIESHPRILGNSNNLFFSLARSKDNSSLFSATMAGYQLRRGLYYRTGDYTTHAFFWSSTPSDSLMNNIIRLRNDIDTVEIISADKSNGYSVRCVKD